MQAVDSYLMMLGIMHLQIIIHSISSSTIVLFLTTTSSKHIHTQSDSKQLNSMKLTKRLAWALAVVVTRTSASAVDPIHVTLSLVDCDGWGKVLDTADVAIKRESRDQKFGFGHIAAEFVQAFEKAPGLGEPIPKYRDFSHFDIYRKSQDVGTDTPITLEEGADHISLEEKDVIRGCYEE